jgi:hypothetical protein
MTTESLAGIPAVHSLLSNHWRIAVMTSGLPCIVASHDWSALIGSGGGNDPLGERPGMILGLAAIAVSRQHLRNWPSPCHYQRGFNLD